MQVPGTFREGMGAALETTTGALMTPADAMVRWEAILPADAAETWEAMLPVAAMLCREAMLPAAVTIPAETITPADAITSDRPLTATILLFRVFLKNME